MPSRNSHLALIQTASGISPTGPSLPRHLSAAPPLLLPTGRCARHLPDCARPPRLPARALPLPPHPRRADVHIEILSFPAVEAAPSPAAAHAASTSATRIAHPPALRSGACARRVRAVRPAS